jgi:hypothetical protein
MQTVAFAIGVLLALVSVTEPVTMTAVAASRDWPGASGGALEDDPQAASDADNHRPSHFIAAILSHFQTEARRQTTTSAGARPCVEARDAGTPVHDVSEQSTTRQ